MIYHATDTAYAVRLKKQSDLFLCKGYIHTIHDALLFHDEETAKKAVPDTDKFEVVKITLSWDVEVKDNDNHNP